MDEKAPDEKEPVKLTSLKDFIEEYQRVIAVTGVFVALALFWKTITNQGTPYLSYLCLLITIPLLLEVRKGFSWEKSSWNLIVFIHLFTAIFGGTVFYLIATYPNHLEQVIVATFFIALLLSVVHLEHKYRIKWARDDYKKRVEFAEYLNGKDLPQKQRNQLIVDGNRDSSRQAKILNILGTAVIILLIIPCLFITAKFSDYLHVTLDGVLKRDPEISPLPSNLTIPSPSDGQHQSDP